MGGRWGATGVRRLVMGQTVLLAVDDSTAELTADDSVLAAAMLARGLRPKPHRWGDPVRRGEVVVIRSTWDYVVHPAAFVAWLDQLDAEPAIVHNPTSLLRWNAHKGYLVDLARRGLPVVPTALVARGAAIALDDLIEQHGWDDVVIKPAVGGTARFTEHAAAIGANAAEAHLRRLVADEDTVVQPYISTITTSGEISVVVIAGQPLVAVAKHAQQGDWRVQSDFGGSAEKTELTEELQAISGRMVRAVQPTPSYARVDLVRHPDGRLLVLELELVEPELFFRLDPVSAEHLAAHIDAPR
jgi:glutathione synthase/RimK-type ligase-like ATP-grasp enzyme